MVTIFPLLVDILPGSEQAQAIEQFPYGWVIGALVLAVAGMFVAMMRRDASSSSRIDKLIEDNNDRMDKTAAKMVEIVAASINQNGETEKAILSLVTQVKQAGDSQIQELKNFTSAHMNSHQAIMLELGKLDTRLQSVLNK